MKMTLSSHNMSNDNRSNSPNSSPRSSPRPSPRNHNKRDQAKSDTYLSVNYKDQTTFQKNDASPVAEVNSASKTGVSELVPSPEPARPESVASTTTEKRRKKKSPWYNVLLYPTYKSRSEDFKQLFKDVPDDERLVVDYSCALQKEILVQGRLYVTQNYLCFYANIFGWETNVSFKWRDVTAITKEKTALVIPNAVLISTRTDRYFFTSFVARDKTYLMLFRVWQNALMDRPMNQQEMWQLVHDSYGAELGLTSDDEDYIAPGTEEVPPRLLLENFVEEVSHIVEAPPVVEHVDVKMDEDNHSASPAESRTGNNSDLLTPGSQDDMPNDHVQLPTDMSDSSESDHQEKNIPDCPAVHEGKQLMNEVIPLHIDQIFTLLFTSSKFFLDFHASRKTADLTQTTWINNASNNTKSRVISLTVALNQAVGPKTAQVTETQVMLPCSKAGCLYSIDVETVNGGIPYADSFCILVHYCIHRISESQTSIAVYAQIKYKKSVWGLVKGMIEKNCWHGLEDFFSCLAKALHLEAEENTGATIKRKSRRRRRPTSVQRPSSEEIGPIRGTLTRARGTSMRRPPQSHFATTVVFAVLILLVILNILLYYKLWSLEDAPPYSILDMQVLKDPPKSHDDWIRLLQKQETLHTVEMQKWQKILKTAIKLLKQTEDALNELQRSIHPAYTNKILSGIDGHKASKDEL